MASGGDDPTKMSDPQAPGGNAAQAPGGNAAHAVADRPEPRADHGGDHGHDDHGHDAEVLGPIDWSMWGVGVLGVALAFVVAACFVFSTGFTFGA